MPHHFFIISFYIMFITPVGMLNKRLIIRYYTFIYTHTLLGKKVVFVHNGFSTGLSTGRKKVMNRGVDVRCS